MRDLQSIEVRGFKSFEHVEKLELRDLNVVIGPNGSGKSNLVSLFRFLERVVSQELQKAVVQGEGAEHFLFHGRKRTKSMSFWFRFGEGNEYAIKLAASSGDTLTVSDEEARYDFESHPGYVVPLASGTRESTLRDEAKKPGSRICRHVLRHIERWRVFHFHDTSDGAAVKQTQNVDDNQVLANDAANLAPFLLQLREELPETYRQVVEHVQLVAPFFEDFRLEPVKGNRRTIKLAWRQRGSSAYFDAFSLSDGTLRFICLATLLLQPDLRGLVLIDEPELGLHPFAIRVLADLLEAASRKAQVLVATQSVTLLNQLSLEDVIVADHDGERSHLSRPSRKALKQWLSTYSVGELWEKNLLGGRPNR